MLMAVRALGMDSKASWFQPEDGDSPRMHVLPHNRSCRFCKGGYVCMQIISTDEGLSPIIGVCLRHAHR